VAKPARNVLAISDSGTAPPIPPLPLPWKLPFQPEAGIQTSILILESLLGFTVAVTRQKAGRLANGLPRAPPPVGAVNAPAATVLADVIVVFGNDREARLSHGTAAAAT